MAEGAQVIRRTPFVAWILLPVTAFLAFCVGFTISTVVLLLTVS